MSFINYTDFGVKLNETVGHLESADQLKDDLARRVAGFIIRFMSEKKFEALRGVTLFQMTVIDESVKRTGIPFKISGCLDGKSANLLSFVGDGEKVPEKELYCDILYFESELS